MQKSILFLPLAALVACAGEKDSGNTTGAGLLAEFPAESVHVVARSEKFTDIRDVLPLADGSMWVLNTTEPLFVHLASDGSVLHEHGRPGSGPEEFRRPEVLLQYPQSNDVWVYDRTSTRHAIVRISGTDTQHVELRLPRDSVPWEHIIYPHFASDVGRIWTATGSDQFYFARTQEGAIEVLEMWKADIIAVNAKDGTYAGVALPMSTLLGDPIAKYDSTFVLMPYPVWNYCAHDNSFVVYDPLKNAVRHFGADKRELDTIPLPAEKLVTVTPELVFNLLMSRAINNPGTRDTAALRAEFKAEWEEAASRFYKTFPEYVGLQCMPDSSVWIQPFDVQSANYGLGAEWLRVTKDGSSTRHRFPASFTPLRFYADKIWGVLRDEMGVASPAWIGLTSG